MGIFQHLLDSKLHTKLSESKKYVSSLKSRVKEKGAFLDSVTEDQPAFLEGLKMQIDWEQILHRVAKSASHRVWLVNINAELLPSPTVSLEGSASSPQSIGDFMKALKGTNQFTKVVIQESGETVDKDNQVKHKFKIHCEI